MKKRRLGVSQWAPPVEDAGGRLAGYRFEGDFDEEAVERLLTKAVEADVVTQFDAGRGNVVWFNGRPGAALRALRDDVQRLTGARPVRRNGT